MAARSEAKPSEGGWLTAAREPEPVRQAADRLSGVIAPVLTPFRRDYSTDAERFVRHCKWLLGSGCAGLAPFGTTSEGCSLSVAERKELLEALVGAGVPAAALMPGTGACALSDALELTRLAVRLGCAGVLMLPPFYYKDVSEEGLFRSFAELIERVGDARLRIYLYHIPPVASVPITLELIERLLASYPGQVAGVKDSSGDWRHTRKLLGRFEGRGFDVFVGSEAFLLEHLRGGGQGCITATANIAPGPIEQLCQEWRSAKAGELQKRIAATRKIVEKRPMIPALKAVLAHFSGDEPWRVTRPPLVELPPEQQQQLVAELGAAGFSMPDLEPVRSPR
jgi:4-hydroxy-tetrahydrodipicolinate synthase